MKILLLIFVALMSPLILCGQDSLLFKIVCSSNGVTLDGKEITPGQDVYSNSKMISVPSGGYVGVLIKEGYAYLLTGRTQVKNVKSVTYKKNSLNRSGQWRSKASGAVTRATWNDFDLIPEVGPQDSNTAGDSLVLLWIDKKGPSVSINGFATKEKHRAVWHGII